MTKIDWTKIGKLAKDAGYMLETNEDDTCNLFDVQCDCYMYRNISANVAMMVIQSMIKLLEEMGNS